MKLFKLFLLSALCFLNMIILHAQPSIGGFKVYYGTLHNHTAVSDGTGTPDGAYNYAKNTGHLDFFGLSDHSDAIDATEWTATKTAADAYNQDGVFTTFRGFEWSENVLGHVTVVNSTNYITTASPTNTFAGLSNWLNGNECVAFYNHPGRNNSTGHEFEHFVTTPSDKFVGMELWNKADRFPVYYYTDGYYPNDGNKSWFDEAIGRGWKVGASGGEDNHSGTWGTATNSRMGVLSLANNRTDIYNAVKAKRFFTTYDKNMGLSFKIAGNEMGSTIAGGSFQYDILASDADGETFTQVQLLKNGAVLQTWTPNVSAVSISGTLTFATGEYYYIRVKQSDSDEAVSSPIWIGVANNLPSTSISSPIQNSSFVTPTSVTITASASDTDGTIQKVEFYQGSTLLGEDLTAPYSYTWAGTPSGTYQLTVKATDNLGASTTSASVQIFVTNPGDPVTTISSIATAYDDMEESNVGNISNNVNSTDIELVYDVSTAAATQVVGLRFKNLNIPQGALITNAYIQFTCDEVNSAACNLTISAEDVDNSAAFTTTAYNISTRVRTSAQVNWVPQAWNVVGEAGINQRTPDLSSVVQEIVSRAGFVPSGAISMIVTGTGSRIAEAYEGSVPDVAKLVVNYTLAPANLPPVCSIASPASGTSYTAPASINFTASATDTDGTIAKVEYFQGATLLGTGTGATFAFTWSNVSVGNYSITAQATDDDGAVTTSAAINVVVSQPNQEPSVSIASPASGSVYTAPASINFTASATDTDGTIAKVEYFQGATLLGTGTGATFAFTWNNVQAGSYSVTAKATDDRGAMSTSSAISVQVNAAPAPLPFTAKISQGSDDVEESAKGIVDVSGDDIELVYDTKTTGSQIVGLRFNGVAIPKDAIITKAYLQFTVDEKTNAGCNLTIKGEKSVNAITFSATAKVSLRSKTLASVNWVPSSWGTVGLSGVAQQTPDLKSIVQEIVSQSGWLSGNSMAFVVTGTGNGKRTAVSYETSPVKAASLVIEYQAAPTLKSARIGSVVAENQVAVEPINTTTELRCYPVPFTDFINVELKSANKESIALIQVFNSNGALVKSLSPLAATSQVQLPGLTSGIYMIRVKTMNQSYQQKIIKK